MKETSQKQWCQSTSNTNIPALPLPSRLFIPHPFVSLRRQLELLFVNSIPLKFTKFP